MQIYKLFEQETGAALAKQCIIDPQRGFLNPCSGARRPFDFRASGAPWRTPQAAHLGSDESDSAGCLAMEKGKRKRRQVKEEPSIKGECVQRKSCLAGRKVAQKEKLPSKEPAVQQAESWPAEEKVSSKGKAVQTFRW